MADPIRLRVRGLDEFRRGLKKADAELPKAVQRANKKFAEVVAPRVRRSYSDVYRPQSGRGAKSIRALGSQRRAQIAIGNARAPYVLGQNFGSHSRYPQFKPKADPDRFLYTTLAREMPHLVDEYGDVLSQEMRDAFPTGGGFVL